MKSNLQRLLPALSPFQRFTIISFIIFIAGMLGIGIWVGNQIRNGVINQTATTTALYMDSFIAPNLQELENSDTLTPEHIAALNDLLNQTTLGRDIVSLKVWDGKGRILFSSNPALIGQIFNDDDEQARAIQGELVAAITDLQEPEHVEERKLYSQLLQVYSPIRLSGSEKIIAVAEFYQKVDDLNNDIARAQRRSWLVVGLSMAVIYLALVGFVRQASNTIMRQQGELSIKVNQLTDLLVQNTELHERVQRAAANTASINEHFLRRISAELHDGPLQELSVALLRMDRVTNQNKDNLAAIPSGELLPPIQSSLTNAIQELRAIAAGFGLPQIDGLSLAEIVRRVVRAHEQRTADRVTSTIGNLPEEANLPMKIALYRVIQEALNNGHQHAKGMGLHVDVHTETGKLIVSISDRGPGFDVKRALDSNEHLGLLGMRERVESLGGHFEIQSIPFAGTTIRALLPLSQTGDNHAT